jgi:hypothetical protein
LGKFISFFYKNLPAATANNSLTNNTGGSTNTANSVSTAGSSINVKKEIFEFKKRLKPIMNQAVSEKS